MYRSTQVFVQVDTDRDGTITGDQPGHLFLIWRLLRGFTFVKELTRDIQNVIAPPKPKVLQVQKETAAGANTCKILNTSEWIHEKDLANEQREDSLAESPSESPAISSTEDK